MKFLRSLTAVLAVGAVLSLVAASDAQETVKHSGSVVAIDDKAGTVVLAEVGPWKLRDGATVITYRTITVTPDTAFAVARRSTDPANGFPGQFVEEPLAPGALALNDYVTIDSRHEPKRVRALKITVSRIESP